MPTRSTFAPRAEFVFIAIPILAAGLIAALSPDPASLLHWTSATGLAVSVLLAGLGFAALAPLGSHDGTSGFDAVGAALQREAGLRALLATAQAQIQSGETALAAARAAGHDGARDVQALQQQLTGGGRSRGRCRCRDGRRLGQRPGRGRGDPS